MARFAWLSHTSSKAICLLGCRFAVLKCPPNHNYPTTSLHFTALHRSSPFQKLLLPGFVGIWIPALLSLRWLKHLEKNRRRPHCRISSRWQGGYDFDFTWNLCCDSFIIPHHEMLTDSQSFSGAIWFRFVGFMLHFGVVALPGPAVERVKNFGPWPYVHLCLCLIWRLSSQIVTWRCAKFGDIDNFFVIVLSSMGFLNSNYFKSLRVDPFFKESFCNHRFGRGIWLPSLKLRAQSPWK